MENDKPEFCDLYIVGCGTLGRFAASQYLFLNPNHSVYCETRTTDSHDVLANLHANITPQIRSQRNVSKIIATNVLIALPPSTPNYLDELSAAATSLWRGPSCGSLVLISSTGVYGSTIHAGQVVTETSSLDNASPYRVKLIQAEEIIKTQRGHILRCAGLYTLTRGPHMFWLRKGSVSGHPDGTINLLHYEDAASAALSVLDFKQTSNSMIHNDVKASTKESNVSNEQGVVFLACDDNPVSRLRICQAVLASGRSEFAGKNMPEFPANTTPLPPDQASKITDCNWTKTTLGWAPKHVSFVEFIRNTV